VPQGKGKRRKSLYVLHPEKTRGRGETGWNSADVEEPIKRRRGRRLQIVLLNHVQLLGRIDEVPRQNAFPQN